MKDNEVFKLVKVTDEYKNMIQQDIFMKLG